MILEYGVLSYDTNTGNVWKTSLGEDQGYIFNLHKKQGRVVEFVSELLEEVTNSKKIR